MMKCIKNDSGHYIVEASIIVPFVLALVIAIGSMCKTAGVKENVVFSAVDEMKAASINSYVINTDVGLSSRIKERLTEENPLLKDLNVGGFRSGFTKEGFNELIKVNVAFGVDIKSPIPINDNIKEELTFTGRKFVGDKETKQSFGYENMEKEESDDTVYIFPDDGKRYHKKDCTYVKPKITEVVLTEKIKKEYDACSICDSDEVKNGSKVYIFGLYGKAYHKKECSSVEKNVIAADRQTAIEKGYTACSKCGG